ncbi:hypothetical protein MRX96_039470 [Rhipicephalus microplus]
MGLTRSILITFGQATVPRKIVYGGGLHLCTPYTPRVETCSNCRTIGHCTDVCIQPRTHRCPRCGQLHPKEANPTCTPVCIICEGPHLSGTRECKHRHLPKVTRRKSPREPRSQEGVDHSLRGASTKRSEPHAGQRKGQSKSSDQPTWADKLKTPNGTRLPATNTPPAPDPRDQELRALRVEATPSAPSGPSAWLAAEQERSSSSGSEYEPDDEEDEDEENSEGSTETTSSSTSTIPSCMLRQWRRIRKCYVDNPDVIGEMHVYRVLTYMGHPHWRKDSSAVSPAGDSPNLTTVLQTTMALRLEDLRLQKRQMEAAWRSMQKNAQPVSRVVLEAKRAAVQELEKELLSLHRASTKMGARKSRRARDEKTATAERAQDQ